MCCDPHVGVTGQLGAGYLLLPCVPGIEFRVSGLVAKTLTTASSPWPVVVLNETGSPVSRASLELVR